MLADQITAFAASPRLENALGPHVAESYRLYARQIASAKRFVLNRDALMMVEDVGVSAPKRLLAAIDICRLPFPKLWVEFSFKDRSDWMAGAVAKGIIKVSHFEDTAPPSRLGFLIEALDKEGRDLLIHPAWSHPNDEAISICMLANRLNLGVVPETSPERREMVIRRLRQRRTEWMGDPENVEAAINLDGRIDSETPPAMVPMVAFMRQSMSKQGFEEMIRSATNDLSAEWQTIWGLLTVLNSRNIIEIGPVEDYAKLNKARAKAKKPLMLSHRSIRLNLSKVQRNRLGQGGGGGGQGMQHHLVRGHWKLRRTGLYWWSPFVRGSHGEIPGQRTYDVRG